VVRTSIRPHFFRAPTKVRWLESSFSAKATTEYHGINSSHPQQEANASMSTREYPQQGCYYLCNLEDSFL
jgi:hypothetical protein